MILENQDGWLGSVVFYPALMCTYTMMENSPRGPQTQCMRIALEGYSTLWAQPFSSISESMMWGSTGTAAASQVAMALSAPPCLFTNAETAAENPLPTLPLIRHNFMQDNRLHCCLSDVSGGTRIAAIFKFFIPLLFICVAHVVNRCYKNLMKMCMWQFTFFI